MKKPPQLNPSFRNFRCAACGGRYAVPLETVRKSFIGGNRIRCLCGKGALQPEATQDRFPWDLKVYGKAPWWLPFLFTGDEGIAEFVETTPLATTADIDHRPFPIHGYAQWLSERILGAGPAPSSRESAAWDYLMDQGRDPLRFPFEARYKLWRVNKGANALFLPAAVTGGQRLRCADPPSEGVDLAGLGEAQLRELVCADVAHYCQQVGEATGRYYGVEIDQPEVLIARSKYNNAGWSRLGAGDDRQPVVGLDIELLMRVPKEIFENTIAHEVAHIVAYGVFGGTIAAHGPEWRSVMRYFDRPNWENFVDTEIFDEASGPA